PGRRVRQRLPRMQQRPQSRHQASRRRVQFRFTEWFLRSIKMPKHLRLPAKDISCLQSHRQEHHYKRQKRRDNEKHRAKRRGERFRLEKSGWFPGSQNGEARARRKSETISLADCFSDRPKP